MLVKCVECSKEVSDRADFCVHCGFPFYEYKEERKSNPYICFLNDRPYDLSDLFESLMDIKEKVRSGKFASVSSVLLKPIREDTNNKTGFLPSDDFCRLIYNNEKVPLFYGKNIKDAGEIHQVSKSQEPSPGTVTCPFCRSTDVKKIGVVSRATGAYVAGIASKKIGKQWHCNKCGSDF